MLTLNDDDYEFNDDIKNDDDIIMIMNLMMTLKMI